MSDAARMMEANKAFELALEAAKARIGDLEARIAELTSPKAPPSVVAAEAAPEPVRKFRGRARR